MSDLEPLLRYWRAQDDLFDRVELEWWGAVVSDPRYPRIQEANYARVEARDPISLGEIEERLLPALRRSGSERSHVVVFFPEDQTHLLVDASGRGDRLAWDLVMEREADTSVPASRAELVRSFDPRLWRAHAGSLRSFDVTDAAVVEELQAIEREVMLPAGRRWSVSSSGGAPVSLAALLVLGTTAYLDHVVTLPSARRRGHATSVVARALAEADAAGAERTYLLAEPDGVAVSLYEGFGFRPVTQIASWIRPIEPDQ